MFNLALIFSLLWIRYETIWIGRNGVDYESIMPKRVEQRTQEIILNEDWIWINEME